MTGSVQPQADPTGQSPTGARRQSVATEREPSGRKSTLIMGGVSLILVIALVIGGFVLNAKNTAVPDDGYGSAKTATAQVMGEGAVVVGAPDATTQLTIFQDPLCSQCGEFARQYGQQIARAADAGELAVTFRMVDFYNPNSPSGDYGTRAYAALLAVAQTDGDVPGLWLKYYDALYDKDNQPAEKGAADLTNKQLAAIAATVGNTIAEADISGYMAQAKDYASDAIDDLTELWAEYSATPDTPTVVFDGAITSTNKPDWLSTLLGEK